MEEKRVDEQIRKMQERSARLEKTKGMQSKISAFFKPATSSYEKSPNSSPLNLFCGDSAKIIDEPDISVTYKRRNFNAKSEEYDLEYKLTKPELAKCSNLLNKKRKYVQLHLEVGQSDFLLHSCITCGFKYAPGDKDDEKVHKTFHKNYTHGITFKGWRNERIVEILEGGRVILIQDCDPPTQQNKVKEVMQMMEMELGDGWILDKHCKVYLYISSQRVSGCLVAEPIDKAYEILSSPSSEKCNAVVKGKTGSSILKFGSVSLQREIIKRNPVKHPEEECDNGVILCKDEAVPALCGIRAIWVTPANRRKHIASSLLDTARKSFCTGLILNHTQIAFSQPTSLGKALISNYTGTGSFLVYTTGYSTNY